MVEPEVGIHGLEGCWRLEETSSATSVQRVLADRAEELRCWSGTRPNWSRPSPLPRITYDQVAIAVLQQHEPTTQWATTSAATRRRSWPASIEKPLFITQYPTANKRSTWSRRRAGRRWCWPPISSRPEGYGRDLAAASQRIAGPGAESRSGIAAHGLPRAAFDWYVSLRRLWHGAPFGLRHGHSSAARLDRRAAAPARDDPFRACMSGVSPDRTFLDLPVYLHEGPDDDPGPHHLRATAGNERHSHAYILMRDHVTHAFEWVWPSISLGEAEPPTGPSAAPEPTKAPSGFSPSGTRLFKPDQRPPRGGVTWVERKWRRLMADTANTPPAAPDPEANADPAADAVPSGPDLGLFTPDEVARLQELRALIEHAGSAN